MRRGVSSYRLLGRSLHVSSPVQGLRSLPRPKRSVVADDLFNFIFFFSIDKIRWLRQEVLAVDFIFAIR